MRQTDIAKRLEPVLISIGWDTTVTRVTFWDDSSVGSADAKSTVRFKNPEALRHILYAPSELGAMRALISGEAAIEGDTYQAVAFFTQQDLSLSHLGVRTAVDTARSLRGCGLYGRRPAVPPEEVVPNGRRHSKSRDAKAVSHHYDVGNDFYRLVLGSSMTYSCARFETGVETLEDAQESKYDLISRKLDLSPGKRLLDVGCGWGGMLLHAAKHYGVRAVGITLSREQAQLAQQRIADVGLSDRVEVRIQDYRDLRNERFDAVSSIGMFEHVGKKQMAKYFTTLHAVLEDEGRLLHHAIDKPEGSVMHPRGFIARYVFPDGELQDIATTTDAMQLAGFEVRDIESLREHYALTLRAWVANLENNWDACVDLVGENRARVWLMYMIGSAVSFENNRISIHQTIGVKTPTSGASGMPLTRRDFV